MGAIAGVDVLVEFGGSVCLADQEGEEGGDGALEVDAMFPESIAGVDEQDLVGEASVEDGPRAV